MGTVLLILLSSSDYYRMMDVSQEVTVNYNGSDFVAVTFRVVVIVNL